jgi:hypothetical protein
MTVVAARNEDVAATHQPPSEIGTVRHSAGVPRPKRAVGLGSAVLLGGCAGAILGLIGFFVVGGIIEHSHGHIEHGERWFLAAILGGPLVGAILAVALLLKPPQPISYFVGELGAAKLTGAKVDMLLFADLTAITPRPTAMGPLVLREIMVTRKDGSTRRWLTTLDPANATDVTTTFGTAVLAAFSQMTPPSRS